MKRVAFVDLDKTLIFSKRNIPSGLENDLITCYQREGEPDRGCWMPKSYLDTLLSVSDEIIIVTARDIGNIKKLNLPFIPIMTVCNFGALIYKGDELIKSNILQSDVLEMKRFGEQAEAQTGISPSSSHKHEEKDVVWHYVSDNSNYSEMKFKSIKEYLDREFSTLTAQINGRQFDVFPSSCLKENAVKYILDHHYSNNKIFTIGMGDSIVDHKFMSLCNLAITPTTSQLFNSLGDA
jgi:HAD superfamily hydrolase (TIGR01484 family)